MVACGAAARNHLETLGVQSLADGSTDAAHPACDVRYFLTHFSVSSLVFTD
jgi:hypothetical protein